MKISQKWPKKGQNDKTPAIPVIVARHQKTKRKSYLEVGPIAKKAIFGQKMPKKCRFAILRAPFGKVFEIRLQILKIQIFSL